MVAVGLLALLSVVFTRRLPNRPLAVQGSIERPSV